jgi:hypothetical protein
VPDDVEGNVNAGMSSEELREWLRRVFIVVLVCAYYFCGMRSVGRTGRCVLGSIVNVDGSCA